MSKLVLIRCFFVSFVISIISTIYSTTIAVTPAESELVYNLRSFDESILSQGTEAEVNQHINSIPMRTLSGLERFTYSFNHPQAWDFILRGLLNWFFWVFTATILVSYLNAKKT